MVCPKTVPTSLYQVQVSPASLSATKIPCMLKPTLRSYLFAGALDGGTQVISFILNFAVFGAAGEAHAFPEW